MATNNTPNTTTIRVSNEFKARLSTHGQFGERFEDILIRLLPKEFLETATGDRDTVRYSRDDVDSRKTKKFRVTAEALRKKSGKHSQEAGVKS